MKKSKRKSGKSKKFTTVLVADKRKNVILKNYSYETLREDIRSSLEIKKDVNFFFLTERNEVVNDRQSFSLARMCPPTQLSVRTTIHAGGPLESKDFGKIRNETTRKSLIERVNGKSSAAKLSDDFKEITCGCGKSFKVIH